MNCNNLTIIITLIPLDLFEKLIVNRKDKFSQSNSDRLLKKTADNLNSTFCIFN